MISFRLFYLIGFTLFCTLYSVCPVCPGDQIIQSKFERIVDFDNHTCREADIVLQHDTVRSRIECVTMCVQSTQCSCVFHKTGYCQGCSSCHAHGPFLDLPGTRYYYLPPDLSQYNLSTFGDHFYILPEVSLIWDEAKDFCNDLGTKLVDINSFDEHTWIITQLTAGYYWTGGRMDSNDTYVWWQTGQTMTYDGWAPNEPYQRLDCMGLWGDANFQFDDTNCTQQHAVMCKSL